MLKEIKSELVWLSWILLIFQKGKFSSKSSSKTTTRSRLKSANSSKNNRKTLSTSSPSPAPTPTLANEKTQLFSDLHTTPRPPSDYYMYPKYEGAGPPPTPHSNGSSNGTITNSSTTTKQTDLSAVGSSSIGYTNPTFSTFEHSPTSRSPEQMMVSDDQITATFPDESHSNGHVVQHLQPPSPRSPVDQVIFQPDSSPSPTSGVNFNYSAQSNGSPKQQIGPKLSTSSGFSTTSC